jgi:hypothetical protein
MASGKVQIEFNIFQLHSILTARFPHGMFCIGVQIHQDLMYLCRIRIHHRITLAILAHFDGFGMDARSSLRVSLTMWLIWTGLRS